MSVAKIGITIDESLVKRIDLLVRQKTFPNRSKAIQEAVQEKLIRFNRGRLIRESKKLDPKFEQKLAEEGMSLEEKGWPEY